MATPTCVHNGTTYLDLWHLYEHDKTIDKSFFKFSDRKKRTDWAKRTIPPSEILRVLNGEQSAQRNAAYYVTESFAMKHMYRKEPPAAIVEPPAAIVEPPAAIVKRTYPLPKLISIDDDDMGFRNEDGKHLEIEMRGERSKDGIFFKAYDVQKCMGIRSSINDILQHKTSAYEYDTDYVYFETPSPQTHFTNGGNRTGRSMYLTGNGLLKTLYRKQQKCLDSKSKQSLLELYFVMTSSTNERLSLASKCTGLSINLLREFTRTCTGPLSGIYLLKIGNVSDLSTSMKFDRKHPTNASVFKFGFTKDIKDRYSKHVNKYSKLIGVTQIEHMLFANVDESHLSQAECMAKKQFIANDCTIKHDIEKELIVLSANDMKWVRRLYTEIDNLYRPSVENLSNSIKDLYVRINLLERDNQILSLKNELYDTKLRMHKKFDGRLVSHVH